ncbi:MAG: DUF262 domain-containing protein [Eubacterium sp.]|jgi:hypothetical protein|nr:DUF262 domain-containing protein [Eubacterium sp.]
MADIFQTEKETYEIDVPKEKRYLNTMSYDYSVQYLYDLMKKGKIILEVPFQRKQIWKSDKSSSLIESIVMNVPIPPLYFAEEENGNWLVLDGLQRLSSIRNFYDNEFSLCKLEVLSELNKRKYKDLPPKSKSLLDDGMLRVNVIKKDSHRDIKYDIFMRLNRGAVTLNYQELRNCMYRGNLNDAAKELCEENVDFLKILKQKKPHQRYLDVEFIIRYFAISDNIAIDSKGNVYLEGYKGKLVQYLNEYMDTHKNCSYEEKQTYKERFNTTIEKVVTVFGVDKAFRDISTENTKIYKTIADFVMPSLERMSKDYIEKNKELIFNRLVEFLKNDDIKESLSKRTSDKDIVNLRLKMWFKEFEDGISL